MGSREWHVSGSGSPSLATEAPSHRRLRLWNEAEHSAPAATERICRHGCASDHIVGGCSGNESGWSISLERSGRSIGAGLCAWISARFDGQDADLWNLSRASGARLCLWRTHVQIEIRPPRRQPAGERSSQWKSRDHVAESRFCSRLRIAAERNRSYARELERRHG